MGTVREGGSFASVCLFYARWMEYHLSDPFRRHFCARDHKVA